VHLFWQPILRNDARRGRRRATHALGDSSPSSLLSSPSAPPARLERSIRPKTTPGVCVCASTVASVSATGRGTGDASVKNHCVDALKFCGFNGWRLSAFTNASRQGFKAMNFSKFESLQQQTPATKMVLRTGASTLQDRCFEHSF
jgi:hypothetical protein